MKNYKFAELFLYFFVFTMNLEINNPLPLEIVFIEIDLWVSLSWIKIRVTHTVCYDDKIRIIRISF